MLLLSSTIGLFFFFLQMFYFIWNEHMGLFHLHRKRNEAREYSRRGSGSPHHTGYLQKWDWNQGLLTLDEALFPFLCSFSVKSMFSDYFPLNALFVFALQRVFLKHLHSFTQSLSMVALWNLWFRNHLVAPNYSPSWIPRMCAPDNQELFIGSLHYIWCG